MRKKDIIKIIKNTMVLLRGLNGKNKLSVINWKLSKILTLGKNGKIKMNKL
jgi:hypothetical protein